jgi:hypothetical protein
MSQHAWVLENIATFNAGGLEPAERERLQQHASACAACAEVLNEAQNMDRTLEALFTEVAPDPALEDRMVQVLRAKSKRGRQRRPLLWWAAAGAAAVVLLGALGAEMSNATLERELLFPGMVGTTMENRALALNNLKQLGLAAMNFSSRYSGAVGHPPASMQSAAELAEQLQERSIGWATNQNAMVFADQSASIPRKPAMLAEEDGRLRSYARNFNPPPTLSDDLDRKSSLGGSDQPASTATEKTSLDKKSAKNPAPTDESYFKPSEQLTLQPAGPPPKLKTLTIYNGQAVTRSPYANLLRSGEAIDPARQDPTTKQKKPEGEAATSQPAPRTESGQEKATKPTQPQEATSPSSLAPRKLVIRSGDIEFEIDSFDAAVATVSRLVGGINGGFIATVNSEKLANGKVRGSVVVRVPPEDLDKLLLDLRKGLGKAGELKNQRIGSQDISKQYTDLESRLRAARAMQERLLQMIKTGKGEIKDLLQAEKELGVWRTKIEEIEGELRYYANLVALSTLTINLSEKEIRAPAAITETERVQMGLEVEDVDKARDLALAAVADAKGRVTKSELKQYAAGQYSAVLQFEVAPEPAGPLRDRLKQLGTLARLEIDRLQQADGGNAPRQDTRLKRNDSQFFVSLYNLSNVEPREKTDLQIATRDVPAGYRALLETVMRTKGRVLNAQLNEQDKQNITAQVNFDVRREEEAAVEAAFAKIGDVYSRNVVRGQVSENVTASRVRLKVALLNVARIPPRSTYTLAVEVGNVDQTAAALSALVHESQGRTVEAHVARRPDGSIVAKQAFDVPVAAAQGLLAKFKDTGLVRVEEATQNPQVPDTALAVARLDVTLSNEKVLVPSDNGFLPQVRKGLSNSLLVIFWSLSWVIFGILVVLPWVLLIYGVYRLILRFRKKPALANKAD